MISTGRPLGCRRSTRPAVGSSRSSAFELRLRMHVTLSCENATSARSSESDTMGTRAISPCAGARGRTSWPCESRTRREPRLARARGGEVAELRRPRDEACAGRPSPSGPSRTTARATSGSSATSPSGRPSTMRHTARCSGVAVVTPKYSADVKSVSTFGTPDSPRSFASAALCASKRARRSARLTRPPM
jgi:hypothetical protein